MRPGVYLIKRPRETRPLLILANGFGWLKRFFERKEEQFQLYAIKKYSPNDWQEILALRKKIKLAMDEFGKGPEWFNHGSTNQTAGSGEK